jgi:serine/threonine protein kinase
MEQRFERDLCGEVVDGRFRVEEKLGSGGMGTVWRVQHVESLQRFALKTLEPTYANQEEATQRFLREARSAAALKTRHVVRIIDAKMRHQHEGAPLPFLVMELLEGQNLQQILEARGRLTPGELVWIAGQLGRALDAAHKQGIVHRDLKPSNVFVAADDDGQSIVKLCDFGIAKLTGDATSLATDTSQQTRTGAMLGTPMYLAPELLRGAGAAIPSTDQWSMGLIGFRALAGVEYFAHVRGFSDLVLTIANDPLVPPSQKAPGLPRAFDDWFLRSCARRPEDRFPDAPAQAAALELALGRPAATPIEAPVATTTEAATSIGMAATAEGAGSQEVPHPVVRTTGPEPVRQVPGWRRMLYLTGASVWAIGAIAAMAWLGGRKHPVVHATATSAAPAQTALEQPAPPPPSPAPPPGPAPSASPAPSTITSAPTPASTNAKTNADASPRPISNAEEKRPAPPSPEPAPHRHHHKTAAHPAAAATPAAATPAKPAGLLPRGAACHRSAECASGLCAAESCI